MAGISRRRLLELGSASLAGLAGCLGTGSGDTTGLTVETLAVAESPGESVPVQPADTVALLDFFATWCAPCKPQMQHLRDVSRRFPDVHMLSITWEDDETAVSRFWRQHEGTWPVATDPDLTTGQAYGVDRIPTLLVLDDDGEETWRHVGLVAADDIAERLREAGATER